MSFQATIAAVLGFGMIGEIILEGPTRAKPAVLKAADAANIVVGRYFTLDASDGLYAPGGTGHDGGILSNPKALQSIGTAAGGPLAPTLVVPAGTVGELLDMGQLVVSLSGGCAIGDAIQYAQATGILKALPPVITYSGIIAVTTGILTVSSASAGANLRVGSPVVGTGVPAGTIITALGTGTGGNGTYQTNIVTAVSAFTDGVAPNNPDTGYSVIPGAKVVRTANTSAGLAIASLTGPQ